MTRLLRSAALVAQPYALGVDHDAEAVAAAIAAAEERGRTAGYHEGHAAGFAEGHAQGEQVGRQDASALVAAIRSASLDLRSTIVASAEDIASRTTELALEIARAVCAAGVTADAVALADRIREALARIDDAPLRVHVCPAEMAALRDQLETEELRSIEIAGDDRLAPGEARITGPWSDADLTWATTWQTVAQLLGADTPADDHTDVSTDGGAA